MATENSTAKARFGSLDDIIRRKLRVSDPAKADEIVKALLKQYPSEKARFEQESLGLPAVFVPPVVPVQATTANPTEDELAQATAYLGRDLDALVQEPAFRSFSTNLQGLAQSINNATAEGISSARAAVDSGQRDKLFGFRRILSDYARLVRQIGVRRIDSLPKCLRLASDIDWISSLMLVFAGEAISKQALKGFLIQISMVDLEARNAAAVNALRNLLGTSENGYDDVTWGWRTSGYRAITKAIEEANQQDLKVLLQEAELNRMLTELVDQIARDNVTGVSAFGPTAEITIDKIQRLFTIAKSIDPQQPPLVAFLNELGSFSDLVSQRNSRIGMRLIDIARSPITYSSTRYGSIETSDITDRRKLINLTFKRSLLTDIINQNAERLIKDKVLEYLFAIISDVDRAIDCYALGTGGKKVPEMAAGTYGYSIKILLDKGKTPISDLNNLLSSIMQLLFPRDKNREDFKKAVKQEIIQQNIAEQRYQNMAKTLIPTNFI
jgi:hypothetical protein